MPGPIPYGLFYQALQKHFPGRFTGGPTETMDGLLADFPELDGILDPATKGSELLVGPEEPVRPSGPVGGVSGLPPVSPYGRPTTLKEDVGLLGTRVAPALAGAAVGAAVGGPVGAVIGGGSGAFLGEYSGEFYEAGTGIAPMSGTNIAVQTGIGMIPAARIASKVPGVGPLINKAAQSVGGRIGLQAGEGAFQGGLSTEADIRLRQDRAPTFGERAFGAGLGSVFGAGTGGAVEGVRAVRSMRAQAKLGHAQHQNVQSIVSFVEQEIAAGVFNRQRREELTPQLQNIFQHVQDPELRQTAAERLENLFLQAHQDDLRALSVAFVQDFQQKAPTLGLYDRMQLAQAFTDQLRIAAADQETIDQTAKILAGLTPGNEPPMPLGLPPAGDAAVGARQGPFYGPPPEGPAFVNRPDSELPGSRTLETPPGAPDPRLDDFGADLERSLQEPPGPPRLVRRPEEARLRRPGAGVLSPELTPQPFTQPRLRFRGAEKGLSQPADQPPVFGETGPLGMRREGVVETGPRVVKGELDADQAFLLHWLATDLEYGAPERTAGGTVPSIDKSHVRKEDEDAFVKQQIASGINTGWTEPGTEVLFGLQALGARGSRKEIAARIRAWLAGQGRKPTKDVQAALQMVDAWRVAYDPEKGTFDWSRLTTPLPNARNIRGKPVDRFGAYTPGEEFPLWSGGGYRPRLFAADALPREAWAGEPRWLVEKYAPEFLAPEEQLPKFAREYGQPPLEVQEFMSRMLADDQDLLEFYDSAVRFGDVEPAAVGWVMHEIEARGLRQFRQPGLQTEGPGSPARRNLPREIAEREPSLFDEPLPENPTPQLAEPDFTLTSEVAQGSRGVQPSVLPSEPPVFGERRSGVIPSDERKQFTPEERAAYERRLTDEALREQYPELYPEFGPHMRLPSPKSERGAVGSGPTKARATRKLVFQNQVFDTLQQTAKAGAGREVAGVLLGSPDGGVRRVVPMRNVAADPSSTFELDPVDLARVLKGARSEGLEVLASYHTQPTGSAEPSKADMRGSVADVPLVILGMDGGDIVDARVWQPGRNRQWAEGSLGVATLKNPNAPPVFQDIKDVKQFVRAIPRLRAAPGDTVGLHQWLDKNRQRYEGEAWFVETERLLSHGQAREAWLKIQTVQLLGERAARAGIRRLPDPAQSAQAVGLVDALVRGGAQDPVGSLFALFDGRTVTVPGVGRVVAGPEIPPELRGSDVFTGPGGIIRPGDRKKKLTGKLTDGNLAIEITRRVLDDVRAPLILDDPTEASATKLFRQIGEQMLLTPNNFKAVKALTESGQLTVEEVAEQYEHAVSEAGRMLQALSAWKQKHQAEIRTIEGIKGAAGDVEDLLIRGKGGRVIGRLGDLTAEQTFDTLVRPTRAWDQVMLLNTLTRQPEGTFRLMEAASRGFMISQFATAARNLEAAGLRWGAELFDAVMEPVAHTLAGHPGRAQAAWKRAAERAKIPYRILAGGEWVGPWRARKEEFGAIYEALSGTTGELLRLAQELDPESAHLLGGVAFGEPTPHRTSKWRILNWIASPKVQNFLTMFNRAQEFTVRAGIYSAEMRAALRAKDIDPDTLAGTSAGKLAELVGGDEALQGLHHTAVHQALNFSFAGDLVTRGYGMDAEGKPIGSYAAGVVNILNKFPILRAGYPFPRFNLSAAPRFLWDHSLIGLFVDPLYARVAKRGRYYLGTKASQFEAVDIPDADRKIAEAQRSLGDALLGRMAIQRRLGTYRRLVNRAERRISTGAAQAGLPGTGLDLPAAQRSLDTLRAERASLQGRLEALEVSKGAAEKQLRDVRSQRQTLVDDVQQARKANAPRNFEELLARNLGGGGALLGAAYLIRSMEGAEGTPWYILKIPKPLGTPDDTIELDFRPFAPFAQYLFVADAIKDLYEYTDWTAVAEDWEANGVSIDTIYDRYEGKYTAESLGRELGNAFLSMSQVAGTTLALADALLEIPTQGVPSPSGLSQNTMRVIGGFLARFTIPFAQLKAGTDLIDDDESKARIVEGDKTQGVAGALLPVFQPLGNLPFLGALLVPETVSQITGKPLDTYAPLLRALTGITARERTQLQDTLTEAGVAPSSIYLRDTGDPFLDRLLGFHYANTLGRALPQILEDPDWQRLTTPAQRRDFLQQLLPKLKASAIGETLEDTDPEVLQSARETREGRRRRLRMERLQRLIDAEGLRPTADAAGAEPPPEEPEPQEPLADEPPAFEGSASGGPPLPPF